MTASSFGLDAVAWPEAPEHDSRARTERHGRADGSGRRPRLGLVTHRMLAAARELGGSISARSAEIEALGTLPMDLVDEIRPTGAFRQCVPDDLGGPGVTATESLEVFEEFAYHDGSVGWCVAIASTTSLLASYLPDRARQSPVRRSRGYRRRIRRTSGQGRADGRRLAGVGALAVRARAPSTAPPSGAAAWWSAPNGRPEPRDDGLAAPFVFMEPGDIEFIDTWDVAGLAGTGSVDFEARDVFVPEGRWAQIGAGRAGAGQCLVTVLVLRAAGQRRSRRGGGNRPPRHRRASGVGRGRRSPRAAPVPWPSGPRRRPRRRGRRQGWRRHGR